MQPSNRSIKLAIVKQKSPFSYTCGHIHYHHLQMSVQVDPSFKIQMYHHNICSLLKHIIFVRSRSIPRMEIHFCHLNITFLLLQPLALSYETIHSI